MPHPTRRTFARWAAVATCCLVVAYPFSFGPLFYYAITGHLRGPAFERLRDTVYAPCMWLIDHNRLYAGYIFWWMELGIEEFIRQNGYPP